MPEDASRSWREFLSLMRQGAFRHSTRVVILLSLGTNRRLGYSQLLVLTGLGKGALSHHLKMLETAGLVSVGQVFTVSRPRVVVTITSKGSEACDQLRRTLAGLVREGTPLPKEIGTEPGLPP